MSVAVKVGIVAFGLLVAAAAYEAYTRPGDPPELIAAQNAVARDSVQKLIDALPPDALWQRVSIDEATQYSVRLTLQYPQGADPARIALDTKAVAAALVRQLTVAGHHPADERMTVKVSARQADAGAILGTARFDPDRDGIVFDKSGP